MSPLGLFFIAKEYIMVIEKILSFGDYCIPKGESKATTYNDLFKYMFNQNRDLTALVQNNLWQPETAYSVDQYVQTPSMAAGLIARCTIAGTTSETEPTWGKADEVVTDGTAKWTMESLQMATVKTLISDLKTSLEKSFTSQISDLKTSMETKMLAMFPVGSIISTTNSANPSTYIGGTWEQLPGGYSLISAGDYSEKHTVNGTENTYSQTYEAGKTYGEMLHQLTVDELASHSHQQYVTANPNTGTYTTRLDFNDDAQNLAIFPQVMTGDTGGNLPHNNMPPVYGTYLFKRIS
mgnify:FL=1